MLVAMSNERSRVLKSVEIGDQILVVPGYKENTVRSILQEVRNKKQEARTRQVAQGTGTGHILGVVKLTQSSSERNHNSIH